MESFNGTFRNECLNTHWFMNLKEARQLIAVWREEYTDSRPHRVLADRTLTEFASRSRLSAIWMKQTGRELTLTGIENQALQTGQRLTLV